MGVLKRPWGARDEVGDSTVLDYMNIANPITLPITHPEYYRTEVTDDISPQEAKTIIDQQPKEIRDTLWEFTSKQDLQNKIAANTTFLESAERVSRDNPMIKYPGMIAASLTDPVGMIPIAGAVGKVNSIFNATTTLGRVGTTALAVGSVGALSNIASESLYDAQDLPTDYTTAAMFGFILGGSLGGISEGMSRTAYKTELAQALSRKDDIQTQNDTKVVWSEQPSEDADFNDVPRMGGYSRHVPDALKSPTAIVWSSPLQTIRNLGSKMSNPAIALKDFVTGKTAADDVVRLNGIQNKSIMDIQMAYRDAKVDGSFKGSQDEFFESTGKELNTMANKQEIAVKSNTKYQEANHELKRVQRQLEKEREEQQAILDNMKANKKDKLSKDDFEQAKTELEIELNNKYEPMLRELEAKKYDIAEEIYNKYIPDLSPAAKAMSDYFQSMKSSAKEAKVKEFEYIPDSRLYMPRQWRFEAVRDINTKSLQDRLYKAMRAHPNNARTSDAKLVEHAQTLALDMKSRGYDAQLNENNFFIDPDQVLSSSSFKARKVSMDTSELDDLLQMNATDVMGAYHYWTRGQIAIRNNLPELQGTSIADIRKKFQETYVRPIHEELATLDDSTLARVQKDLEALDYLFKDLLGYSRMASNGNSLPWVATRLATQANAITYSGMFGLNQLLEIPNAMWATGFNRIFHKQFGTFMSDINKALATDGAPRQEFLRDLANMGFMESLISAHGVNRVADTQSVFNTSKLENHMMGFTHKLFKYNGMRGMTAWLEAFTASNATTKLRDVDFSNISSRDRDLFNQWGLDDASIKNIQDEFNRVGEFKEDGTIVKLGLDQMNKQAQEDYSRAIRRSVESGVIQGDTYHLPSWMTTPRPMVKLLTQFMRFPIAAQEILVSKGIDQDTAGWVASIAGAYMMGMGMFYLLEQAELGLGIREPIDQKYDLDSKDGIWNLGMKSTNYVAGYGSFTPMFDQAMLWTGQPQFGRDYAQRDVAGSLFGITGSRINAVPTMMEAILDGRFDDERLWKTGKGFFVPMNNLPIAGQGMNMLIEDLGRKY